MLYGYVAAYTLDEVNEKTSDFRSSANWTVGDDAPSVDVSSFFSSWLTVLCKLSEFVSKSEGRHPAFSHGNSPFYPSYFNQMDIPLEFITMKFNFLCFLFENNGDIKRLKEDNSFCVDRFFLSKPTLPVPFIPMWLVRYSKNTRRDDQNCDNEKNITGTYDYIRIMNELCSIFFLCSCDLMMGNPYECP